MRCELDGRLVECLCHCVLVAFITLKRGAKEGLFVCRCLLQVSSFLSLVYTFFSSLDGRKEGPCRGREVWPGTS